MIFCHLYFFLFPSIFQFHISLGTNWVASNWVAALVTAGSFSERENLLLEILERTLIASAWSCAQSWMNPRTARSTLICPSWIWGHIPHSCDGENEGPALSKPKSNEFPKRKKNSTIRKIGVISGKISWVN